MANISLEGSIRTCKVDTGWANKLQSDRFLNPNIMMCPVWGQTDTQGRKVHADTFNTKRAGCNSALDRVSVENAQRPQYIEYVTLDAQGIRGSDCSGTPAGQINPDSVCHQKTMKGVHQQTGQFGLQTNFSQNVFPNCMSCNNYPDQRAKQSQTVRNEQYMKERYINFTNKRDSGMSYGRNIFR